MHLHDALASQGRTYGFDPAVALDGLDEVVTVFFPRQVRLQRTPAVEGVLTFTPDDVDAPPLALGDGPARATVSGPAAALLQLVWKRIGQGDVRLTMTGDVQWAKTVLSQALTP